jgi:hypothetical protein
MHTARKNKLIYIFRPPSSETYSEARSSSPEIFQAPARRRFTEHSEGRYNRSKAGTRLPQGVRVPTRRHFMERSSHYGSITRLPAVFRIPSSRHYTGHPEEFSNTDKRMTRTREGVKALPQVIVSQFSRSSSWSMRPRMTGVRCFSRRTMKVPMKVE